MADVYQLMRNSLEAVPQDHWQNHVRHIKTVENRMWEADWLIEIVHDKLVINLEGDSEGSNDDDDEDDYDEEATCSFVIASLCTPGFWR